MFLGGWQDLDGLVSPPLFWLLPSSSGWLQVVSSVLISRSSYCGIIPSSWPGQVFLVNHCLTIPPKTSYSRLLLFSHSVVSDSLRPHGLQHARLLCPSPSPRACSNPCPLSWWYHPTISSSVIPFSSCLQSFPASGPFLMSWLFASGGQSIGASLSASVLAMNIQGWFPLGLTGWIFLQSKGLSGVLSNTTFI